MCVRHKYRVPPRLLMEPAAALNEAYAEAAPLAGLMAHHRLMALARAPLYARVTVVRRLAELDPTTPFWDDDVRAYERARLDEMRVQVPEFVEAADSAALQGLHKELASSRWRSPVPSDLQRLVADSLRQTRAAGGLDELARLVPQINDAYQAADAEHLDLLFGRWHAVLSQSNVAVPVVLEEQVQAAGQWLAEQQETRQQEAAYHEAAAALMCALDANAPRPELERAPGTRSRSRSRCRRSSTPATSDSWQPTRRRRAGNGCCSSRSSSRRSSSRRSSSSSLPARSGGARKWATPCSGFTLALADVNAGRLDAADQVASAVTHARKSRATRASPRPWTTSARRPTRSGGGRPSFRRT